MTGFEHDVELDMYNDYVNNNEEYILSSYIETNVEFPDYIYEGVLDDDFQEAEEKWLSHLTIDDVPSHYTYSLWRNGE